jgi:hypothetical protein
MPRLGTLPSSSNRVCFSEYRNNAASDDEAHHMRDAGELIRSAPAEQGYAPR